MNIQYIEKYDIVMLEYREEDIPTADAIIVWCQRNFPECKIGDGGIEIRKKVFTKYIHFNKPTDKMAFKLVWGFDNEV